MSPNNTAGKPDRSFGENGVVDLNPAGDSDWQTSAVSTGSNDSSFVALHKGSDFVLTKRLGHGGPNLAFGGDGSGYATWQFQSNADRNIPEQIHLIADGRILVIGDCMPLGSNFRHFVGLARFNANGEPDLDFGTEGRTVIRFKDMDSGHPFGHVTSALQPDGKILVAISSDNDTRLARLTREGHLDDSFGTQGFVDVSGPTANVGIYGILVQNVTGSPGDFKIVVGGTADPRERSFGFAARYNAQGQLDDGNEGRELFGEQGYALLVIEGKRTHIRAVIQDARQNIYLTGGYPAIEQSTAVLGSFTVDGKTNPDFNQGHGPVLTTVPYAGIQWLDAVATRERLNVLGYATNSFSEPVIEDISLGRFTLSGDRDEEFGEEDYFATTPTVQDSGKIAVQPDGRLLLIHHQWFRRFLA